jgi:hypothetical protein
MRRCCHDERVTLLVDECRWPWRGRRWCHLVSDASLDELHRFARRLALPRRAFQGDHYDLHEQLRAAALDLGAVAVTSRELVDRLRASGLRLRPAARRAPRPPVTPVRLDPRAWLGRPALVVVDRPLGSSHPHDGRPYPVNVGYLPGTAGIDGLPLDAYVLGPGVPLTDMEGRVAAVVRRLDDVEDRLVVARPGTSWPAPAIHQAIAFQERHFDVTILQ